MKRCETGVKTRQSDTLKPHKAKLHHQNAFLETRNVDLERFFDVFLVFNNKQGKRALFRCKKWLYVNENWQFQGQKYQCKCALCEKWHKNGVKNGGIDQDNTC